MHDELVRRNYAATTIRTYLHTLRTCERYHRGRRLDQLGATALRRYHAHLFREKKLGRDRGAPCGGVALFLCACAQAPRPERGAANPEAAPTVADDPQSRRSASADC